MQEEQLVEKVAILEALKTPFDIEKYDVIDDEYTYNNVEQTDQGTMAQATHTTIQSLEDIWNYLFQLSSFLSVMDKKEFYTYNKLDFTTQQQERRRNEQMQKVMACKLKTMSQLKFNSDLKEFLNLRHQEERKLQQSIDERSQIGSYASNPQLVVYSRFYSSPPVNDQIYLNLYNDRFAMKHVYDEGCFFLPLIAKDFVLTVQKDHLKLISNEQLVITLIGKNKWIAYSLSQHDIYEKLLIYGYLKHHNQLDIKLLGYRLQFRLLTNNELTNESVNAMYCGILLAKLLYELNSQNPDPMKSYLNFIKVFLIENHKLHNKLDTQIADLVLKQADPETILNIEHI